MKASPAFKKTISDHLQSIAATDALFAETLKKTNKNIDDCVNYIFSEVQKSGNNGFADEEIFAMAIHYYDEDDLKVSVPKNMKVVINHSLSKDQKSESKATEKVKAAPKVSKSKAPIQQTSIFG